MLSTRAPTPAPNHDGRKVLLAPVSVLPAAIQSSLFPDTPLWFAPTLAAILITAWYLDWIGGIAAALCGSIAVNYWLLAPVRQWSIDAESLSACAVFFALGSGGGLVVASIRRRLVALERAQALAHEREQARAKQFASAEQQWQTVRERLERALVAEEAAASSSNAMRRYITALEKRFGELQQSLTECPLPLVVVRKEEDEVMLCESSVSFNVLSGLGPNESPAMFVGAGSFIGADGVPFSHKTHPIERAFRGEFVIAELVGFHTKSGRHTVLLWASRAERTELVTLAMVPVGKNATRIAMH